MNLKARVAGAPVSWGVVEVPDWGYQMKADRVLSEAASVGLSAIEAGPEGFLPGDPPGASRMLADYRLRLVGGFVPIVLHRADTRGAELASVERQAKFFADMGADVLVVAAATGQEGYEKAVELDEDSWQEVFRNLLSVEEICSQHGLAVSFHPHFGTIVERPHHLERFLDGCRTGLCLDTGHVAVGGDDPNRVAEIAAQRVNLVHLKDVDHRLAEMVAVGKVSYEDAVRHGMFKPLGEGEVDIEGIISVLEASGYRGWYVLEQDVMLAEEPKEGQGPLNDVRKSLKFIEGRLDGSNGPGET